jgi:hypothetical protein
MNVTVDGVGKYTAQETDGEKGAYFQVFDSFGSELNSVTDLFKAVHQAVQEYEEHH